MAARNSCTFGSPPVWHISINSTCSSVCVRWHSYIDAPQIIKIITIEFVYLDVWLKTQISLSAIYLTCIFWLGTQFDIYRMPSWNIRKRTYRKVIFCCLSHTFLNYDSVSEGCQWNSHGGFANKLVCLFYRIKSRPFVKVLNITN